MKNILTFLFVLVIILGLSLQAHAILENRGTDILGNRLIYDTDLNITWYDHSKGWDNWQNQMDWTSALTVNFGGTVFDDWRLPTTFNQECEGIDCINSEMGHLYYQDLGNDGYISGCTPGVDCGLVNTGLFENLEAGRYWSDTLFGTDPIDAWCFNNLYGIQSFHEGTVHKGHFAIAVRAGDIAVAPEPVSMILFGVGGVVLGAGRMISRQRGRRV